ncbi:hypothetical protein J2TS6_17320 [Paenibacillus albilobatus]|uniref:Uncharacterized protein n=1 Tax=Paenibacillus albilobatus TaxID=2716884 RepID=A0A919XDA6_9BACL|nr:hypothetical protein J2TS6_17320 [Paenibacillus albilobatus]
MELRHLRRFHTGFTHFLRRFYAGLTRIKYEEEIEGVIGRVYAKASPVTFSYEYARSYIFWVYLLIFVKK